MINSDQIDDITSKITAAMPAGLKKLQQDAEKNIRVILQASFAKLDLVSREEFDIQSKLLQRTREKLTELERRVEALSQSE